MKILAIDLLEIKPNLTALFQHSELLSQLVFASGAQEVAQQLEAGANFALIAYRGPTDPNLVILDQLLAAHVPVVVLATNLSDDTKALFASKSILDYVIYQDSNCDLKQVSVIFSRYVKNKSITALVVDDTASYRTQVSYLLGTQGLRVLTANDGLQALAIIQQEPVRIMVTDYEMPNMDGLALTKAARKIRGKDDLAIIVFTASENSRAADFLKMGANDFLNKPFTREELTCRIDQNMDLIHLMDKLRDSANRDFLTALHNRRYFLKVAGAKFVEAKQSGQAIAVAMLDIDFFKKINDTYGHEAGDEALRTMSKVLLSTCPHGQLVARLGGEEFAMMFTGEDAVNVEQHLQKIRQAVEQTVVVSGSLSFNQTVSIGYVSSHLVPDTLGGAMMLADKSLYQAKHQGRNRVIAADASMMTS